MKCHSSARRVVWKQRQNDGGFPEQIPRNVSTPVIKKMLSSLSKNALCVLIVSGGFLKMVLYGFLLFKPCQSEMVSAGAVTQWFKMGHLKASLSHVCTEDIKRAFFPKYTHVAFLIK